MAKVNICNVEVLNNPASFFDPFKFRITFECHEPLDDDLEWKLVYVSSAYNPSLDQTLDSVLVGPIPVGRHQFFFEANAPDPKIIPNEDIVGVTVVLIQALYRDKEFIRVGYYVNNEYKKEELRLEPPAEPILDEFGITEIRTILLDAGPVVLMIKRLLWCMKAFGSPPPAEIGWRE
ncbi:Histone chaperone asf1a-A [Schistosoma japonicum]|nr:Histone chaperone asf1a-A [Schistosoma japonicum]